MAVSVHDLNTTRVVNAIVWLIDNNKQYLSANNSSVAKTIIKSLIHKHGFFLKKSQFDNCVSSVSGILSTNQTAILTGNKESIMTVAKTILNTLIDNHGLNPPWAAETD